MFHWDDLRFFLAVARSGSLSGAARALRVNHSTVLRRIKGLEERVGARLFERLPEGYALTPAGEDTLTAAADIETSMLALDRRLSGRDLEPAGTVRITTTNTLAMGFLLPALGELRTAYPSIRLELATDNAFFDLARRQADVALRPDDRPPEHLVGRRLASLAWAVYAARSYLDTRPAPATAADLAGHVLIGGDDSLAHLPATRWLHRTGGEGPVALRTNDVLTQLHGARAGLGVAVLPCFLGDPAAELVRVLGPLPELASGLWLLTHPDLRRNARVRAVMEYLSKVVAERRELLAGRTRA